MKKFLILASFLAFGTQLFAEVPHERITGPYAPVVRCAHTDDHDGDFNFCTQKLNRALKSGCVSENEYRWLRHYMSVPVCDEDDELTAWCPCPVDDPAQNQPSLDAPIRL